MKATDDTTKKTRKSTVKTAVKEPAKEPANEKLTILGSIDHIVRNAKGSRLSHSFYVKTQKYISFIADTFELSLLQAVLFSLCIERSSHRFDRDDISEILGISRVEALVLAGDFDVLVRRRLIRYRDITEQDTMFVPNSVINALKQNKPYYPPQNRNLDIFSFFDYMNMVFCEFENNSINFEMLDEELSQLLANNSDLGFVQKVNSHELDDDDRLLLLFFCHKLVNDEDDMISCSDIESIFSSHRIFSFHKMLLTEDRHELIVKQLVEHHIDNGLYDRDYYSLTSKVKKDFLPEYTFFKKEECSADVLRPETIVEKHLFFSDDVASQIEEMAGFLDRQRYSEIRDRMRQYGFRSGFACLFYGAPGTGKTESVYQLARRSGRSIMVVDVPQIKSKWVGDSEKNIKALFDRYRALVGRSELAPILLFNEADAIIGIRKAAAENSVDKMENAIQNIILQEMETLDGIMIATTNLVGNLDKAFERRFLYKVCFEKPDAAIRGQIWKLMVNDLKVREAEQLAAGYDFSGGQIENVARKYVISCILHGKPSNRLSMLRSYCDAEQLESSRAHRIGF